jgi:hypothetical protein
VRNRGPPVPTLAILVAVALLGVSQQPAGAGIRAAYGMTVPQALAALQEATEKLEFDEDKLLKAESNLALDKAAVQDDLHGINHPLAVGLSTAEQVMDKGKIDTRKLEADRPTVPVLEAIVEEDKKRLVGAQLDYERAQAGTPSAVSASPSSSPSSPEPKQTPDDKGSSTRSAGGVEGDGQKGGGREQSAGHSHYDDSPYYPSRHWESCPPCQDGTPQEIADWLESTIEGMAWLQSQSGLDWLLSSKGQRWLETAPGAEWPFTQAGESFFTSDWGRKFLQSQQGHVWLKTPPGQRWLREHQPWASSVLRIRNAAALSFFAVCFAGVLSAYFTPKGEL